MTRQVLTANRLRDGLVVFLATQGWVEGIEQATVATDAAQAKALDALGKQAEAVNEVVGAYLVDLDPEAPDNRPAHIREVLRTRGPSVRTDLGKQAGS